MNLPDAARHLADLITKLNAAITAVENDPKLSEAAKDLGGAWDDIKAIAKDLA